MTRIKIKKIEDLKTEVAVNSGSEIIEHIKAEIARCDKQSGNCQVKVFEMWDNQPEVD